MGLTTDAVARESQRHEREQELPALKVLARLRQRLGGVQVVDEVDSHEQEASDVNGQPFAHLRPGHRVAAAGRQQRDAVFVQPRKAVGIKPGRFSAPPSVISVLTPRA
jgi:hypothetical protein